MPHRHQEFVKPSLSTQVESIKKKLSTDCALLSTCALNCDQFNPQNFSQLRRKRTSVLTPCFSLWKNFTQTFHPTFLSFLILLYIYMLNQTKAVSPSKNSAMNCSRKHVNILICKREHSQLKCYSQYP